MTTTLPSVDRRTTRSVRASIAALGVYALVSFLYFGLPVVAHPARFTVGSDYDPYQGIWSMSWWPHAILQGENPVVTSTIWAPGGFNTMWATTIPALALAFAPLTLLAGGVASYDVAAVLMPALAAWTAFLLCRHLTSRFWPSLVGGYLFGFSNYMLAHELGHLVLTSVFTLPLVALAVLRYVEGTLNGRGLLLRIAALLAFEFAVSVEVAFTLTLALAVGLGLASILAPERRVRIRSLLAPLAGGYVLAGAIVAPLLYYSLSGFESHSRGTPSFYPADLLNLVVPLGTVALSGHWLNRIAQHFIGNTTETSAYLGVPLIVIVLWFAVRERRRPGTRILVSCLAVALIASLGYGIFVEGRRVAPAPWALVRHLPLFNSVLPVRLSVYVFLATAVIAAVWGSSSRPSPLIRGLLLGAAVATQMPAVFTHEPWKLQLDVPAFFAKGGGYETCVKRDANLLVLPYLNASLYWQQARGFRFRLAAPYLTSEAPPALQHDPVVQALLQRGVIPPGGGRGILGFARAQHVDAIVVPQDQAEPWRTLLSRVAQPLRTQGVLLYSLRDEGDTRCGRALTVP